MPQNLWNNADAAQLPDLEGLVYRSNILGRDRAVVNIYGGNTSANTTWPIERKPRSIKGSTTFCTRKNSGCRELKARTPWTTNGNPLR